VLEISTSRFEDTFKVGQIIGTALGRGNVVCLYGDLGVGKTVLAQGIGCGMGVKQLINSPTFNLINLYENRIPLYHLDLYRLEGPEQLEQLGWEEYIFGDGVAVIEWPEVLQGLLPANYLKITLEKEMKCSEEFRLLTIEGIGKDGQTFLELLRPLLIEWV